MVSYDSLEEVIGAVMEPEVGWAGADVLSKGLSNRGIYGFPMLRSRIVRIGLPWSLFTRIQAESPITESEWSTILDLSGKTLQRYAKEGGGFRFRRLQSDRILDVAEVTDLGMAFFGDKARLRSWLTLPNWVFQELRPLDLLADAAGCRMVCEELGRMEQGIFA